MTEPRVVEGGSGLTTVLRAALPSLPVVNLLPGIRKDSAADPSARNCRHGRMRAGKPASPTTASSTRVRVDGCTRCPLRYAPPPRTAVM